MVNIDIVIIINTYVSSSIYRYNPLHANKYILPLVLAPLLGTAYTPYCLLVKISYSPIT